MIHNHAHSILLAAAAGSDQFVDKDWVTAAGATLGTVAIAILLIVFVIGRREQTGWLRTILYFLAFGVAGFAIYLFFVDSKSKNELAGESNQELSACRTTISSLSSLVNAKLVLVHDEAGAQAMAQQMRATIDNGGCTPK